MNKGRDSSTGSWITWEKKSESQGMVKSRQVLPKNSIDTLFVLISSCCFDTSLYLCKLKVKPGIEWFDKLN